MKRSEFDTALQLLPETVLHHVFRLLSARDLAALSQQDSYLRTVASDSALWEPLALARWPGAHAAQHGGDWHRLYCARAPLPHAFPLAADRIRSVTAVQQQRLQQQQQPGAAVPRGALPQVAFEDVMRQTFLAGVACTADRSVKRTPEWLDLKADLTWWAAHRPEVVVAFIRGTHEALAGTGSSHGGWGGGGTARGWADTPWRRSAVAFLLDLGLLTGAHASVANRITAEANSLDRAIRNAQREAATVVAPVGVPTAHWWYH